VNRSAGSAKEIVSTPTSKIGPYYHLHTM